MYRIGIGYDTHILVENKKLILGGVDINYHKGLLGHSDADVLLHVVADAILGAIGMGDIGKLFPDTDNRYKGISSVEIVKKVYSILSEKEFEVVNLDCVLICQEPKIAPYSEKMKEKIATILNCSNINIKATTTEKMNDEGKGKCISAQSIVLVQKIKKDFK